MNYLLRHSDVVGRFALEHMALVGTALLIALAVAVPAGVFVARHRRLAAPVYGVLGVIYTIPSLALLALLIPIFGLGFWTAVIALAAYAQMILVRNTATAIAGVNPATVEAARGMGMSDMQTLWRVERPLAMPVFVAGVRLASVSLIGIATIAAWINAGGLGSLVLDGIEHDYPDKAVAGALAAVILAFAADFGLRKVETLFSRSLSAP